MFQIGQLAVYPAHGFGRIESVQEREVSGTPSQFYIMRLLDTDMIIMIPTNNARNIGLRDVSIIRRFPKFMTYCGTARPV